MGSAFVSISKGVSCQRAILCRLSCRWLSTKVDLCHMTHKYTLGHASNDDPSPTRDRCQRSMAICNFQCCWLLVATLIGFSSGIKLTFSTLANPFPKSRQNAAGLTPTSCVHLGLYRASLFLPPIFFLLLLILH